MKEVIHIRVRETASNSSARVLGRGITANCTMSPKMAAERAAQKFFGNRRFALHLKTQGHCCGAVPWEFTAEEAA